MTSKFVCNTILGTIGNTPLVRLNKTVSSSDATLYAKLEWFNPGGSIKDRPAINMIEDAEQLGILKPNSVIVESSSGNLSTALAMAGVIKGYKVVCVCDQHLPKSIQNKLHAYGAETEFIPDRFPLGYDTAKARFEFAKKLVEKIPNAVMLNQYDNPANANAHYKTTGQEIWEQTDGKVDAVVVSVGTCGTATGVARALKERKEEIKIIAADPIGSILFGGKPAPYFQEGAGNIFYPRNRKPELIDQVFKVSDQDAFDTAHALAREEGLLVGASAGGVVFVALGAAREMGVGKVVVAVLPDSGEKYLDTVYSEEWINTVIRGRASP